MSAVRDPAVADARLQRGADRDRRALWTSGVHVSARVISLLTALITIPLTSAHLGAERFGVWMTVSSLTALLAFADFGLGNGLLNTIATALGRADRPAMRLAIGSAMTMLAAIGLVLLVLAAPVVLLADLSSLFGVRGEAARAELRPTLLCFLGCFVLTLQAGVVQRVLSGLQLGFINGLLGIGGSLLGLLAVVLAVHLGAGLPWLVFGLLGLPAAVMLLGGWWWLRARQPDLIPSRGDAQPATMLSLARLGGLFFVLQLAASLAASVDNLIGSASAGAAAVGDFAVAQRLFGVVGSLVAIVLTPMWPAYGEAIAAGDTAWVRRRLVASMAAAAALSCLASLLLWAVWPWLMQWWLGRPLHVSGILITGFAAWTLASGVGAAMAMLLNGAGVVGFQVIVALGYGVATLSAKLWLTPNLGLDYLPWITALGYLATVLLPYLGYAPRLLRGLGCGPAGKGAS